MEEEQKEPEGFTIPFVFESEHDRDAASSIVQMFFSWIDGFNSGVHIPFSEAIRREEDKVAAYKEANKNKIVN